MAELLEEQRENWGSRAGFVLAAIGSAVGLGNLWGFPYKLYKHGGGAFLIPYICAMIIIGIPVLILECSLGHMTQRAAPNAFRKLGRRKEPVGWWGIFLGFVIITYYAVILAWCLSFFYYSIQGILFHGGQVPWAGIGAEGVEKTASFFSAYTNQWRAGESALPWLLGSISPKIVLSLAIIWVLMFLCIFRGVRTVSKVVFWTVPLPWLMLLILAVRGLTLEGATRGLAYYLNPDWSQLLKPTTWRFAFGQVFFSMSLAFGVMVTYASFLHRRSDINNNATIIGLGDLGTSFVAGIAVFSTLGAMSLATGLNVDSVAVKGPGLAFVAFPYALAQLPAGAWFSAVFFFALITLGIDSAFSITESVLASIVDKTRWNRTATLWGMTFVGFALGLVYCARGGVRWIGDVDDFINGPWGIALLGLLECVVLGWMYRISRLREHANQQSDWRLGPWWDWNIRLVVPVVLSALFIWSLYETVTNPGGYLYGADGQLEGKLLIPTLVGLILAAAAPIVSVVLSSIRSRTAPLEDDTLFDDAPSPGAPAGPREYAGAVLGCAALVAAIAATGLTINANLAVNAKRVQTVFETTLTGRAAVAAIGVTILAGALAAILGSVTVVSAERRRLRPSPAARIAGALGTISLGTGAGLSLAFWVLAKGIVSGEVEHSTEMLATAYVILAVMLGIIVVGLGWCFYRALRAAGAAASGPD